METKNITKAEIINNTEVNLLVDDNELVKRLPSSVLISEIIERVTNPESFPNNDVVPDVEIIPILEIGGLSRNTGELSERSDAVRTADFVKITGGTTYLFSNGLGYKVCVNIFDSSKNLLTDWNGSFAYAYVNDGNSLAIPENAGFIKFYCSDTADITTKFILKDTNSSTSSALKYLEFVKQYFSKGHYYIQCSEIDPGLWQLELGSTENEFNIVKIKAPENNPHESTLALSLSGNGSHQIADLSCMRYDETAQGQVCLILQSRSETPLPYFFIGFNDGKGAGRVQKLRIEPDSIPMRMTKDGIRVRRNNNYDNNWAGAEVTVNLATMYDKVEKMYNALLSNGTITE